MRADETVKTVKTDRTDRAARVVRWLAGTVLALGPLTSHLSPLTAQSSLTIYNDGRVLVRRTLPLEVPKGNSTQWVMLGQLDPSTLFSLDTAVAITASSYDPASDFAGAMRRAIGRKLVFRSGRDTVTATVLSVAPETYKLADGSVTFSPPGQPLFPADLVSVDPVINLTLEAQQARKDLRLGYFSSGAAWQASYEIVLAPQGQARISGAAVISSSGFSAADAEVQLLAGSVSQAAAANAGPRPMMAMAAREADAYEAKVSEQKVGEFHLYSLPGRTTILPGRVVTVALFDPASARYERNYVVRGQIPYWGGLYQSGDEQDVPVEVSYILQRPRKTEFGDRPIPGGVARLFQADSSGRLQLVGESGLDHTPAGEELRLYAGSAFDLTAKRIQATFATRRDSLPGGGWQTSATADYRVTLKNAGDKDVTIDVEEHRGGEWSVLSSSVSAQKVSSTLTRFRVSVPAGGKTILKYRVKVIW
jgi:hypothetical protein